jgi:hypothetical protein
VLKFAITKFEVAASPIRTVEGLGVRGRSRWLLFMPELSGVEIWGPHFRKGRTSVGCLK